MNATKRNKTTIDNICSTRSYITGTKAISKLEATCDDGDGN